MRKINSNTAAILGPGRTTLSYKSLGFPSRGVWRQWPPAYFALLGDQSVQKGLDLVITGYTSLGSMATLLKNAALLIANCTFDELPLSRPLELAH